MNQLATIRPATATDARSILEAQRAAVLRTAAASYSTDILMAWAAPITPDNVRRMADVISTQSELALVAIVEGAVAGFGSIVPKNAELRAIYVHPDFSRKGIGGQILTALERLARQHKISALMMDASLNAEDFYLKRGFVVVEYGEHELRAGARMRCVKMRKIMSPVFAD